MSNKKSGDSGSNESRSNDSRSNYSGSEELGSSNRSPRQSRRDRKPRRWTAEETTDSTMPRPILVQKAHPKWDCKREGCRVN